MRRRMVAALRTVLQNFMNFGLKYFNKYFMFHYMFKRFKVKYVHLQVVHGCA